MSTNTKDILISIYRSAIKGVQPNQLIRSSVRITSSADDAMLNVFDRKSNQNHQFRLANRPIFLFGAGKAIVGMCNEFLEQIDSYNNNNNNNSKQQQQTTNPAKSQIIISGGQLNIPFGSGRIDDNGLLEKYQINQHQCGRYNIPDVDSVYYTQKLIERLNKHVAVKDSNPIVIGFISGGGSALLALPKSSISIEQKRQLIQSLIRKGANIVELNSVRSCLSQVKHGQLAKQILTWNKQCQLITFIISDIIGDPIDMIASGPTVLLPSPSLNSSLEKSNNMEPKKILEKYSIEVDENINRHLTSSSTTRQTYSNPIDIESSSIIANIIIGNNSFALNEAKNQAEMFGFKVILVGGDMYGEARSVVRTLLELVQQQLHKVVHQEDQTNYKGIVWLAGGETTIKMANASILGKGGRCQEMGLLFLDELNKMNSSSSIINHQEIFALFAGTDGQDGPTDAAGVQVKWPADFIDGHSCSWSDVQQAIDRHDSYSFWTKYANQCLLKTGITGTNVMDIYCLMISFNQL